MAIVVQVTRFITLLKTCCLFWCSSENHDSCDAASGALSYPEVGLKMLLDFDNPKCL